MILDGVVARSNMKINTQGVGALVIFQIGNRKESNLYIDQKKKYGDSLGISVICHKFPEDVSEKEVVDAIDKNNNDENVSGIILQLPIPDGLDKDKIIDSINPDKDVDGLTATNLKRLISNKQGHVPATARGILNLLNFYKIPVLGKKIVVIGKSNLVGKPTALLLLRKGATVTICHSKTTNLEEHTKTADIIISAAGVPNLIRKEYVKEGQIIIDVGITMDGDKLLGDVNFEEVSNIVSAISPVPGGVGPMTVAALFENLCNNLR